MAAPPASPNEAGDPIIQTMQLEIFRVAQDDTGQQSADWILSEANGGGWEGLGEERIYSALTVSFRL